MATAPSALYSSCEAAMQQGILGSSTAVTTLASTSVRNQVQGYDPGVAIGGFYS
jgi:hypothetical protein